MVITTEVASSTLRVVTGTSVLLVATDADRIHREVEASVGGNHQVLRVRAGTEVLDAVITYQPVVVVLDLQIGNMGGMAACLDLRLEQRAGRIDTQKVVMLLDREADVFLGRQAEADAWLVKPIDPLALSRLISEVLANQPA